jgi:hypothetical protein
VVVPIEWGAATDSYERFKCPLDGKPYDTDKASDWKMTPGNTMNNENSRTIITPEIPPELFVPIMIFMFIAIVINRRVAIKKRKVTP